MPWYFGGQPHMIHQVENYLKASCLFVQEAYLAFFYA